MVRGLSNYGPLAAGTLPALYGIVSDPSWETRRAVADTLGRVAFQADPVRGPSEKALNVLAGTLIKDQAAGVRLEAVQSLIVLGPPGIGRQPGDQRPRRLRHQSEAVPRPGGAQLKVEKDKGVLIWLTLLVMKYDGSQVTEANVRQIANHVSGDDGYARVQAQRRARAARAGGQAGGAGDQPGALASPDPATLAAALNTLTALGETAKPAVPELEKLKAAVEGRVRAKGGRVRDRRDNREDQAGRPPPPRCPAGEEVSFRSPAP